jgi:hypothetical protein
MPAHITARHYDADAVHRVEVESANAAETPVRCNFAMPATKASNKHACWWLVTIVAGEVPCAEHVMNLGAITCLERGWDAYC